MPASDNPKELCLLADEELMTMVANMNEKAFEVIYDRHSSAAYSLAYRICGSQQVAEDACQEAFLSVWRSGQRYNSGLGSVRSWLLSITHNRAIDIIRKNTRIQEHVDGSEEAALSLPANEETSKQAIDKLEAHDMKLRLKTLPADQSQVIALAFYSGYTHTEIADLLSLPVGTVKGRMRLGLDKLRVQLVKERS